MDTTVTATFCATLVDEWVRGGVTDAFVAPGSRSTPLALALAANSQIHLHLFHDERAASFAALGNALAAGRPTIALCTSGTAAAHFHAPVIEADLSGIPLIVCTADRPPELWSVGAPQTIDQTGLYGSAVRWFAEPGVPDDASSAMWRSLASRSIAEAVGLNGSPPGPVHLNLSFRDPLVGDPAPIPAGRPNNAPWHQAASADTVRHPNSDLVSELVAQIAPDGHATDGVIVVGRGGGDPKVVDRISTALGWPVLADHRSRCRGLSQTIRFFDTILRLDSFSDQTQPRVILRLGETLASKSVSQWIARQAQNSETVVVSTLDQGRWIDPERVANMVLPNVSYLTTLAEALEEIDLIPSDSARPWHDADAEASHIYNALVAQRRLEGSHPSETEIMAEVVQGIEPGGALVVSSSMPIRDLEWFGPPRQDISVFANRGANGIDGVVSTAIGVALGGQPTTVVVGDVAMVHDSTSLVALTGRPLCLHIVVVNNDGGGIFSFLPQKRLLEPETFETLFGTPHGTDLPLLFAAHHIPATEWPAEPVTELDGAPPTVRATIAFTDREENQAFRDSLVAKLGQKRLR